MTIRSGRVEATVGGHWSDAGWRFNFEANDDFWPEPEMHEGRKVVALLDQGMIIYEEDDVIHPPTIIRGTLSSDLLEDDEVEDNRVFGWTIDTIDGRYDLGSVIVCWKWDHGRG